MTISKHKIEATIPFECKYGIEIFAEISWPPFVEYNGMKYYHDGKAATEFKTGMPCVEYRSVDGLDRRVWHFSDGSTKPE